MFNIDIITLFAFFGTFQGLVFSVIFRLKNKNISNKIFSLFLLVSSLRIAKNIFVHLRELNPDMFSWYELWRTLVYLGISHQFAIGPLFLLYFSSKLTPKFYWKTQYLWHFVPYILLVGASPFIRWPFWANGGLWLSYISILTYYLLAIWYFNRFHINVDKGTGNWLTGLLIVVGLLLMAYSPALFHYVGYVGGAFLYTIAILTTGYIMISNKSNVSFFRTKYETSSLSNTRAKEIKDELEKVMQLERPFVNPELTMQGLADQLSVRPHHLSRVINQEFNSSFTEYINSFRLEEATKRLMNPKYGHLKISALAYECGFNSVPTFNSLFKKVHKVTPSQFRNNLNKNSGP